MIPESLKRGVVLFCVTILVAILFVAFTDSPIEKLDQLLESNYSRKLYLLGERNGEFYFSDGQKNMIAVQAINELKWVISEVEKD